MSQPNDTAAPQPTPEQLQAARDMIASQQTGVGPAAGGVDPEDLGAQLAAGQAAAGVDIGGTDVDTAELLAGIRALQDRVAALEKEKRAGAGDPLANSVESLRALLALHAAHSPGLNHDVVGSMADDLADAASNAVESGDTTQVGKITGKIAAWLGRAGNPGPGDFPYYRQAVDFATYHVPDAAANVEAPTAPATAIGTDRAPAKVLQGNVTG
jgi:hypothetical protein